MRYNSSRTYNRVFTYFDWPENYSIGTQLAIFSNNWAAISRKPYTACHMVLNKNIFLNYSIGMNYNTYTIMSKFYPTSNFCTSWNVAMIKHSNQYINSRNSTRNFEQG